MRTPARSEPDRSVTDHVASKAAKVTPPAARWLSADAAATYLSVSLSTLRRYRAEGLVPKKIRGRLLYDRLAIDAFLEAADAVMGGDE